MIKVEEKYTVANMSAECLKKIIELENDLTGKTNQNIVLICSGCFLEGQTQILLASLIITYL